MGAGATWPQGSHGICGDPAAGPLDHEAGGAHWSGAVQGWYHDGQALNLTVTVTAFHKGRFQFRICRIAGTGALAAASGICKGAAGLSHRDPTPPLPRCIDADVASEKAQLTEACLDSNALVQANVPGAQVRGANRHRGMRSASRPPLKAQHGPPVMPSQLCRCRRPGTPTTTWGRLAEPLSTLWRTSSRRQASTACRLSHVPPSRPPPMPPLLPLPSCWKLRCAPACRG